MFSRGNLKRTLATVVAGVLVGGGVTMVSPAGAEVSQLAATNWNKIWKNKLQKKADKRYYTKAASDAKYSTKTDTSSLLGNYYTKAQSDAAYAPKAQTYTKAESDAKYAPVPTVIRGTTMQTATAAAAGAKVGDGISWGVVLSAAPTPHYIKMGDPVPAGCSGTPLAPNADAGHLCVFENFASNTTSNTIVTPTGVPGATAIGAVLFGVATAAGDQVITTNWAVRPAGFAAGVGGLSAVAPGASVFAQ